MRLIRWLFPSMLVALACASCATARQTTFSVPQLFGAGKNSKPQKRTFPISKFVVGGVGQPIAIVEIDPKNESAAANRWDLRKDFRGIPPSLHSERTIKVVQSDNMAFMDKPLCQASPTIHVRMGNARWGKILYENMGGRRDLLLRQIQALVEANCTTGQIKAIQLAVFERATIRAAQDGRYLDRYDTRTEGTNAGRYVYYGIIVPNDEYALIHHDADGLARYLRTNVGVEREAYNYAQSRRAEQDLQQRGLGGILSDYCASNPAVCSGFALSILDAGKAGSDSGSNAFAKCMSECNYRAPDQIGFCQSSCYEFVGR